MFNTVTLESCNCLSHPLLSIIYVLLALAADLRQRCDKSSLAAFNSAFSNRPNAFLLTALLKLIAGTLKRVAALTLEGFRGGFDLSWTILFSELFRGKWHVVLTRKERLSDSY